MKKHFLEVTSNQTDKNMENRFDMVIIGSGLGGLECGVILSKEGYKVCIVEQSAVFGGCFQSFSRSGRSIDTGIHYMGSMGEGQIMRQYLKYFGIFDSLDIVKLDDEFDVINLGSEAVYGYHQGYDNFMGSLTALFPTQEQGIKQYCKKIREIGSSIATDVHQSGAFSSGGIENLGVSAVKFIDSCVCDPVLRNILAGTNVLYGGTYQSANLYHHAMINHSNIEGSYRFVGGTQNVADMLVRQITNNGGVVLNRSKVVRIEVQAADVKCVELENGEKIYAKQFISDIHPASTFAMVGATPVIKKAYKSRLNLLPNTSGLFSVYLLMKPNSFPYCNKNYYYYHSGDVWDTVLDQPDLVPKLIMLSTQLANHNTKYSDVVTLMSPINNAIFDQWQTASLGSRGRQYDDLKAQITENIIAQATRFCPRIRSSIESVCSASPLTYQHYTGTPQGSAYGILKDYRTTIATLLPTRTKLNNLFLTGQNLNVHGALGVTLTAAKTCAELLGTEYLAKKIGNV
ncbi:MAG: NAD(P)/FAD-dependent oxidoreductase [Mucinivorans sp.]